MEACADSEHIVTFVEKFYIQEQVYIVSKFAAGGDLLHYCLQQGRDKPWMDEDRARHIFIQIARGVRDMHSV